jgi:hypothetical protein
MDGRIREGDEKRKPGEYLIPIPYFPLDSSSSHRPQQQHQQQQQQQHQHQQQQQQVLPKKKKSKEPPSPPPPYLGCGGTHRTLITDDKDLLKAAHLSVVPIGDARFLECFRCGTTINDDRYEEPMDRHHRGWRGEVPDLSALKVAVSKLMGEQAHAWEVRCVYLPSFLPYLLFLLSSSFFSKVSPRPSSLLR